MRTWILIFAGLSTLTAVAWADEQEAGEEVAAEDCASLEEDAKAECEKAQGVEDEDKKEKGGKAKKSSSSEGRLESIEDE